MIAGLVPFLFVSILICILARRRMLRQRFNNMARFSPRNPQVFVSPVVLYPNQIYPSQSESNLSQPPPSYETVKKTFIMPNEIITTTTATTTTTRPNASSETSSIDVQEPPQRQQQPRQALDKENESNSLENQV